MNHNRAIATVARGDEPQPPSPVLLWKLALLIARLYALLLWMNPDLQEMGRLSLRWVELAMAHACTGAHPLHFAWDYNRVGASGIFVCELARDNVRDDLHVAVRMCTEALARRNVVLINHAQIAKPNIPWIVVLIK